MSEEITNELDNIHEPVHSPKGASSAERWMNCPGSAVLLKRLKMPETDEPEYRGLGIAAHEAAAHCLEQEIDTWEIVGQKFHTFECDPVMADAVQVYLDFVRPLREGASTVYIEQRVGSDPDKRPHPDFYGTVDFAAYGTEVLDVVDYKHGEGIVVDPDENPQLMYYAYGILHERIQRGAAVRSDRVVRLTIVQPRAYSEDGVIRSWETTAGELIHWAETTLIPAMENAEFDMTFDTGKWCRFCPAKLVCPLLTSLFGAAMKANPAAIPNFKSERLGLEYTQRDAVKAYMKALEEEIFRRNMTGNTVPGTKLVQKKAKRVFKEGAEEIFKARFGEQALEPPSLKSPSQMADISPDAKKLVGQWAYMPNTGFTVAGEDDNRGAVKVERVEDVYASFIDQAGADAPTD